MDDNDTESGFSHWDFGRDVAQTVKLQIDLLLNYIVKSVKNKEERRNRYLIPLKYLLCYVENSGLHDILKLDAVQEAEFVFLLRKQTEKSNVNATKFIAFCRKTLFLEAKVWYVEKLNISPKRYSLCSTIDSFSFLDIRLEGNRKMLQEYMRYIFTVMNLNLGTIRIKQTYLKEFLKYTPLYNFLKNKITHKALSNV